MQTKNENWGGQRNGAGRKNMDVVKITISLPKEQYLKLKSEAEKREISFSKFLRSKL